MFYYCQCAFYLYLVIMYIVPFFWVYFRFFYVLYWGTSHWRWVFFMDFVDKCQCYWWVI